MVPIVPHNRAGLLVFGHLGPHGLLRFHTPSQDPGAHTDHADATRAHQASLRLFWCSIVWHIASTRCSHPHTLGTDAQSNDASHKSQLPLGAPRHSSIVPLNGAWQRAQRCSVLPSCIKSAPISDTRQYIGSTTVYAFNLYSGSNPVERVIFPSNLLDASGHSPAMSYNSIGCSACLVSQLLSYFSDRLLNCFSADTRKLACGKP